MGTRASLDSRRANSSMTRSRTWASGSAICAFTPASACLLCRFESARKHGRDPERAISFRSSCSPASSMLPTAPTIGISEPVSGPCSPPPPPPRPNPLLKKFRHFAGLMIALAVLIVPRELAPPAHDAALFYFLGG